MITIKLKDGTYINLYPGDRLVAPITSFGLSQHHVIYVGTNNGTPSIIENKIGRGVKLISVSDFLKENQLITRVERFQGNFIEQQNAVNRAYQSLGKPYNLVAYNCEHFANEIQTNRVFSPQVQTFLFLGLFGLIVYEAINS